ncbi:MAG: glycoside hydrolase family 31 protein [Bacteroidales bacterium]|nr:glycoside hydrolase family 31 protein [Bacteroidales bacterium]
MIIITRPLMDIATSGNTLRYSNESGVMDYFFLFGNSQADLLELYTGLTGRQEIPPLWSLGYIQSRYGYETQQEAEDVVEQMQNSGFPLDALVLDLYWFGSPGQMGNLSWDYSRFPDPEQMIDDFEDDGIKTILITEPYFTVESNHFDELSDQGYLATQPSGDPFVLYGFWAGDAGLLDVTNPDARNWMWDFYRQRNAEGVAGWWTDLAEPESHPAEMQHQEGTAREVHNIFNLKWQQMLHEKHAEEYPEKRLFNLSRSGWAGMQRYSTFPWSGDIQRSFAGLQAQIPAMLGMSMSGVGYMHSDIGGFTGGGQNEELYTRWMQLGAFAPVMRAHGHDVPPEPIYYDTQTQDRVREMIKLRYRFLPYNYQLAYENTTYGLPLARPMNFHEPQNNNLTNVNDAFFWGNDVLVSPVLEEGQNSKEVIFPSGEWYGFETTETFPGNTTQTVAAPLDKLPLYIRGGSFLMLHNKEIMTTEQYQSEQLEVQYYLPESGNSSNRRYYVDDGKTRGNIAQQQYEMLSFTAHPSDDMLEIELDKEGNYVSEREMEFVVFGLDSKPSSVAVNEFEWEVTENETFYQEGNRLAWWSDSEQTLKLNFSWSDTLTSIKVGREEVGLAETLKKDQNIRLYHPSPNPFKRDTRVTMDLKKPGEVNFALRDISGSLISAQTMHFSKGRHQFMLSEIKAGGLKPGVYFLRADNQTGKAMLKLVKVK